jgi:hypothetical protein
MLYGTEKQREMARSILPSNSRRSAAADLAAIKRRHRRALRRELAALSYCSGEVTIERLDAVAVPPYPDHEIREVVRERRRADKVGPLMRWAVAVTRDLRNEDRLSRLAAALPTGLIGAHAVSHLEDCSELVIDGPHRRYYNRYLRSSGLPDKDTLVGRIGEVIAGGEHGALNRYIKHQSGAGRLLLGFHDVDSFVEAVLADRSRCGNHAGPECLWVSVCEFLGFEQ